MFLRSARLGALLIACALVLGCGRQEADTTEAPAGVRTRAVAVSLPAGAQVVVSGHDLEGFWARLQATQLYRELQAIPDVRNAMAPLAESRQEIQKEICIRIDEGTLMSLFGRKFDVGYYGNLPGDRADLLMVADVADEARARSVLEECERQLASEKGATFRDEEIEGEEIRVANNREGEEVLFYSLDGARLAMSTTRERLGQALALRDGEGEVPSMTTTTVYLETLKKLPESTLVVYVDQQALRTAAQRTAADTAAVGRGEAARQERLAAATSVLGDMRVADAIVIGAHWTESGLRGTSYTRFPEGERPELAKMLTRTPAAIRTLSFQPVGTLFYGSINSIDARIVYDEAYRYAVDATRVQMGVENSPDSARADSVVATQLAAFERQAGIDLDEDVVAWVGEETALAITGVDKTGFFPIPEVALTIATKDRARTGRTMSKIENRVSQVALQRASIPLQWQTEEYQGQTIRYAPTPLGEGLALAYTVTEDFLLLASSRGLVRRMLDARGGRAQALPSNPDFGAMTRFYPEQANALGFVNIQQILIEVEGLMATYGQMAGAAGASDTTSTMRRVLSALRNAPRLGFYSEGDDDGVFGHFLLEVK